MKSLLTLLILPLLVFSLLLPNTAVFAQVTEDVVTQPESWPMMETSPIPPEMTGDESVAPELTEESPLLPDFPPDMDPLNLTEEEFDSLTEEEQQTILGLISNLGPGAAMPVSVGTLDNTVSCFDYYTFGSVQVNLSPTVGQTVSGVPMTFTGTVDNDNPYPVVEGAVYMKVFKRPADGSLPVNGYDVIDQGFVAENISIPASSSKPLTISWTVPAHLLSGDYQAAFYFSSAHRFNLLGLPFTDDVTGNTLNFTVTGERTALVSFAKDSVTVDGNDYYFAAFTPKVDAAKPIVITANVHNDTDKAQTIPVTWDLYAWDQQRTENLITSDTTTVTVPANSSTEVSYTVTDTNHSVYLAVASLKDHDVSSILNVRFTRTDVTATRINFPAVTSYPLIEGEETTLFSCLHGAGTLPLVEDNSLTLTLIDQNDNLIHTYTYTGGITGEMMGVLDTLVPTKTYDTFNLQADLYHADQLVDSVTMTYDCAELGAECLTSVLPPAVTDPIPSKMSTLIYLLLVLIIVLIGFVVVRKHNSSQSVVSEGDGDDDSSGGVSGQSGTPALLLALTLGVSVFLGGGAVAEAAAGASETVHYTYPGHLSFLGTTQSWPNWSMGLNSPSITVHYNASVYNADNPSQLIGRNWTVPVGTRLNFVPSKGNISYTGTGYAWDTPQGVWLHGAAFPDGPLSIIDLKGHNRYQSSCSGQYYIGYVRNPYLSSGGFHTYIPLSIHPAHMYVDFTGTTAGLAHEGGNVYRVTAPGTINATFRYDNTYGYFYYEFKNSVDGRCITSWGATPMGAPTRVGSVFRLHLTAYYFVSLNYIYNASWAPAPLAMPIPALAIPYNLTAVSPNTPPTDPAVISSPTNSHIVDQSQTFTLKDSIDPEGDNIRYGIDWDQNTTIDQWAPNVGHIPSNSQQTVTKIWSTSGVKTFDVIAEDVSGGRSGVTTHSITICAAGEIWDGSNCVLPPPTGTLSATDCDIPDGSDSCVTTVSWNVTNPVSPSVKEGVTEFWTNPTNRTIDYGSHFFYLYDVIDVNPLDFESVVARCAPGTWSTVLSECATPPVSPILTILASPDLIRKNETAEVEISITANYDLTCDLYGVALNPIPITHTADPNTQTYTEITRPLQSAQQVTLNCPVPNFPDEPPTTADARIDVVPEVYEN